MATIGGDRRERRRAGSNPETGPPPASESVLWHLHRTAGVVISLEPRAVAEPLPSGGWIRPAREPRSAADCRGRLRSSAAGRASRPGGYRVLVGCSGGPAVQLAAIAEYCDMIQAAVWPGARFREFGPILRPARPDGGAEAFGQALADLLGRHVLVGTGVRSCGPAEPGDALDRILRPGGAAAGPPFAADYGFLPRGRAATRPDGLCAGLG